jgi:hypothetical protein
VRHSLFPVAPAPAGHVRYEHGYGSMNSCQTKQAIEGCDFDFLDTSFVRPIPESAVN